MFQNNTSQTVMVIIRHCQQRKSCP